MFPSTENFCMLMPVDLHNLSIEDLKKIKKYRPKNSRKSLLNTNNIKKNKS